MAQVNSENSTTAPVVTTRLRFLSNAAGIAAGSTVLALAVKSAAAEVGIRTSDDPIFAAIERHRALSARYSAAVDISAKLPGGPEFEAADAIAGERMDELQGFSATLIHSEPTTLAGVATLLRYVAILQDWQLPTHHEAFQLCDSDPATWHQAFCETLANAVDQIGGVA